MNLQELPRMLRLAVRFKVAELYSIPNQDQTLVRTANSEYTALIRRGLNESQRDHFRFGSSNVPLNTLRG